MGKNIKESIFGFSFNEREFVIKTYWVTVGGDKGILLWEDVAKRKYFGMNHEIRKNCRLFVPWYGMDMLMINDLQWDKIDLITDKEEVENIKEKMEADQRYDFKAIK